MFLKNAILGFRLDIFVIFCKATNAFGPDTRITATPHLPYPLIQRSICHLVN